MFFAVEIEWLWGRSFGSNSKLGIFGQQLEESELHFQDHPPEDYIVCEFQACCGVRRGETELQGQMGRTSL